MELYYEDINYHSSAIPQYSIRLITFPAAFFSFSRAYVFFTLPPSSCSSSTFLLVPVVPFSRGAKS